MRRAALLLALLAAGCGGAATPDPPAATPETEAQAECRREALRSPEVQAIVRQSAPDRWANVDRLAAERRGAEQAAFIRCLRQRGIGGGAGVERLNR
jgi:hypothetical protein